MSSNRFDVTLRIEPRPSRWLATLLLLTHGGAMAVIPPLALPVAVQLGLCAGIVVSLVRTLPTHALLRSGRAVVQLVWDADGHWTVARADGTVWDAELLPFSYVHTHLVVLNFRMGSPWRRRSVILTSDSVDPPTFRRLRARLLTHG